MLSPRRTERLVLRELVAADGEAFHAFESDPEVVRYMTWGVRSLDEVVRYVNGCRADAHVEPRRTWELAVVRADDERVIGRTGFNVVHATADADVHDAVIWYVLERAAWGHGYAGEAVRELLRVAFADVGVHRAVADVDPRNAPSAKLCERLGMRREAHFVENIRIGGDWCDTWIYALLRREWLARAADAR